MSEVNRDLAFHLLFQDPETGEELRPIGLPEDVDGKLVFIVESADGQRKWRHELATSEV